MGVAGPLVAVPSISTNRFELAKQVREEGSFDAALALIRGAKKPTILWVVDVVWPPSRGAEERAEGFDLLADALHQVLEERAAAELDALWKESPAVEA